ncbi:MAG: glycerol-3-phosphate 1-O-acyltransferase PlsY [Candidatus Loosdrechtia sp.]|uniref:glycerol-3-phosphate acyltransferase n=1 Tax=Candidatus Loosdrechtia sp. TaxID=3101272 RepID=UPI003A616D65|nr:MAG: glycerol-3-phosphate 1-O-acyltransferase PlsY [Candidatus Jettenia sp. AMX2]
MSIQDIMGPVISYFIGSIPFGFLVTRMVKGIDIRQYGSGNPGATNVGRVLGKPYGVLVFILDMQKGFLPVFLFERLFSGYGHNLPLLLCGLGVICGHTFPLFLGFKGGKAVATGCGVFLWLAPLPLLISAGVWLLTVSLSRYISLGSMLSAISLVVCLIILGKDPFGEGLYLTLFSLCIAILLFLRHKSNIKRIINGTENKIGIKVKTDNA